MQATIDIGTVLTCTVEECTYNQERVCDAPFITVGEDHPACDTFTTGSAQRVSGVSEVQRCRVAPCSFNDDMTCTAAGITVSGHTGHADCITYRQR